MRIQAAVERAKQLREERKSGINDSESHTFTPQLNKRPSYLSNKADSLDKLASEVVLSDDIFEKPLPGKKSYGDVPSVPSPGSDALGKEMKKFPGDSLPKDPISRNQSTESNRQNNKQIDPDENFMSLLRSDANNKSNGPGWNDDMTTDGGFDTFNKGKKNAVKPSRRTVLNPRHDQQDNPSNYSGRFDQQQEQQQLQQQQYQYQPQEQSFQNRVEKKKPVKNDWNSDTEVLQKVSPHVTPRQNVLPQQRADVVDLDGTAIRQARSKLSLLKSKIRQSESGNAALRSQSLTRSGSTASLASTANSSDSMYETGGNAYGNGRKTAPYAIGSQDEASYMDDNYQSNGIADRGRAGRIQPPKATTANYSDGYEESSNLHSSKRAQNARGTNKPHQDSYYESPRSQNNNPATRRDNNNGQYDTGDHYQFNHQQSHRPPHQQSNNNASINRRQPPPQPQPPDSDEEDNNDRYRSGGGGGTNGIPDEREASDQPQLECPDCHRKFNPVPYEKHIKICAKVFLQKRKTFDSQKMRIQDNPELVKILTTAQKEEKKKAQKAAAAAANNNSSSFNNANNGYGDQRQQFQNKPPQQSNPQQYQQQQQQQQQQPGRGRSLAEEAAEAAAATKAAKWKEQSDAFRAAMKAARAFSKAVATGAPLPPPVISAPDPSLIPCPHCGRRFNDKAAERHIPQCKNIIAKPSTLKRGAGGGGGINGALSVKSNSSSSSSSSNVGKSTKGKR